MRSDDCESVIVERNGETHGRSVNQLVGTIACTLLTCECPRVQSPHHLAFQVGTEQEGKLGG